MDDIKREELEKACKKIHKVRARMVAVRMVRVLDMSVGETASLQVRCPTRIRDCCAATTKEALKAALSVAGTRAGPDGGSTVRLKNAVQDLFAFMRYRGIERFTCDHVFIFVIRTVHQHI